MHRELLCSVRANGAPFYVGTTESKTRTRGLLLSRQQGRMGNPTRHLLREGGIGWRWLIPGWEAADSFQWEEFFGNSAVFI